MNMGITFTCIAQTDKNTMVKCKLPEHKITPKLDLITKKTVNIDRGLIVLQLPNLQKNNKGIKTGIQNSTWQKKE